MSCSGLRRVRVYLALVASVAFMAPACSSNNSGGPLDLVGDVADQASTDGLDQQSPDLSTQDQTWDLQPGDLPLDLLLDLPGPQDLLDLQDLGDGIDQDVQPLDSQDQTSDATDIDEPDTVEVPLDGFGSITGECGVLDPDEFMSSSPFVFVNHLDFGTTTFTGDLGVLSVGAQEVYTDGNAGGSSAYSETFSFDVLYRCELAQLIKTENEVDYTAAGSMTDILVGIDSLKVGVSVVRAQSWPLTADYTLEQADKVLRKKLNGILESSALVSPEDAWVKQILHVIAYNQQHADMVLTALAAIESEVKSDTIVVITVTDGDDEFIYTQ